MRPPRTRTTHLLIAGVLSLGFVACSDDDGDSADDTVAVTDAPDVTAAPADTASDDAISGGTGTPGTPGTASGEDAEACEALQPISDYDAQTGPLVQAGDWDEIQTFIVDSEDEVIAAYEATAELVPDISDALLTLRDLTADYTAAAAEASDLATWVGDVTQLATVEYPGAGSAGLDVNTWAVEHCGFSTGGQ